MNHSKIKIGVVMDPIGHISPEKDTTLAIMLAAQEMGATLFYMEQDDLYLQDGAAFATIREMKVFYNSEKWFEHSAPKRMALGDLDVILMRKDPPMNKRFIHACHMLEQAARDGARVVNDPTSLILYNDKLLATHFPEFCPPYVVSSDLEVLRDFWKQHENIIIKPLDSMGGEGIFLVDKNSVNFDVIWELETQKGTYPVQAQAFIPEITEGDKRIVILNGEPFTHAQIRLPKVGSIRANIASGGNSDFRPLNDRELEIATTVGKRLIKEGIIFAGIDIIGDYLIEVNITSPGSLRTLSEPCGVDLGKVLMEKILS